MNKFEQTSDSIVHELGTLVKNPRTPALSRTVGVDILLAISDPILLKNVCSGRADAVEYFETLAKKATTFIDNTRAMINRSLLRERFSTR